MFRTINDIILSGTSITSNTDGETVEITNIYGYSVQVSWTSTIASATVILEESNDGENWVAVVGMSQVISNDSDTVIMERSDVFTKYMRASLVYTSGTVDTLSIRINAKGI